MTTVGELRAELANYGDHVPVVIVVEQGEEDRVYLEFEVGTRSIDDVPVAVDLTVAG